MTMTLAEEIKNATAAIRGQTDWIPDYGVVLGTGLGGLVSEIETVAEIPYDQVPGFPLSTVESHAGRLLFGSLGGKKIVAMQGRFHRYEGYSMQQIVFPIRVMRALGAKTLVVSNACGGMNPLWQPGELMLISDHINLLGDSPLIGPNDDSIGPRFPDMSQPYDPELRAVAKSAARQSAMVLHEGVYVAVTGPNLETPAEYRFLRGIGADVVGMSTVPEVIAAVHAGMRVLGVSLITDACLPDALEPVNIDKIIATASKAEPQLTSLIASVLKQLS